MVAQEGRACRYTVEEWRAILEHSDIKLDRWPHLSCRNNRLRQAECLAQPLKRGCTGGLAAPTGRMRSSRPPRGRPSRSPHTPPPYRK
jgi:hypothetical protein